MSGVLINGQWQQSALAQDRGLFYGDGLFETMSLTASGLALWQLHLERLQAGCDRLHIPRPDPQTLEHELNMIIEAGPAPAVVKLIYTRGEGERGYRLPAQPQPTRLFYRSAVPLIPQHYWCEGVVVRICDVQLAEQPALAGLKSLNRLEQVLARAEWHDEAVQEGIMCDHRGEVIEGTMSNIFVVNNGELFTPALDRCGVAGVMRRKILELAQSHGIAAHVDALSLDDVVHSDEVFLSNSLIGIWPVRRLAQQSFEVGAVTRRLQSLIAVYLPYDEVLAG